jgi:hypothetical protein
MKSKSEIRNTKQIRIPKRRKWFSADDWIDPSKGTDYTVSGNKQKAKAVNDPLAFLDESQQSFRRFAKQMVRKLGGPPRMSRQELARKIGKALKGHRPLSQEIIRMREE